MEHQQVYTREHTHEVYLLEHTSNGEPGTRSQTMIAAQDNSRSTAIELNHLTQGNHPLQGTECRLSLLHSGSREGRREGGEGGRRGREEGEGGGRRGRREGGKDCVHLILQIGALEVQCSHLHTTEHSLQHLAAAII